MTHEPAGGEFIIPVFRNPLRLALSASPWRSARYLAGHLVGGTILGAASALAAAAGATAAATVAGLPLLRPAAGGVRRCADAERRRLRLVWSGPVRGEYAADRAYIADSAEAAHAGPGALGRAFGRWRDPAIWRDIGYLVALWLPLALLDVAVLSVWAASLAGVTLPLWYWAPRGTDLVGYVHGTTVHGLALGYFPHGPAGPGAVGLYADTLPRAMLAAAIFGLLFVLFNYVLVKAARTHAAVALAWLAGPAGRRHGRTRRAGKNQQTARVWPAVWLYLVVTWLAAGALLELQPVIHLSAQVLTLTQFGPSIGVLVVLARRRGAALQIWQGTVVTTLRQVAVGIGILAGVFGLCLAALAVTGHAIHLTSPESLGEPFWLIAVAQLVGACGEELGWRSFLQPHLQQRYSIVVSALIVGVLWATWHVEYFSDGLLFFAAFLVLAVAISVILAVLTRGASSLAVAGVFHWLVNLAVLLLLNFATGSLTDVTVLAVGFVIAAVVLWGCVRLRSHSGIAAPAPPRR
jgi:uncharacterized protein